MAFSIPSVITIIARVRNDFLSRSDTGDAVLRVSTENAFAYMVAGAANGLYGFLKYQLKQIIPGSESDLESILRWANRFLPVPQTPPSKAAGNVKFTGVDTTLIPSGSEFATRDGVAYITDVNATIGSTTSGEVTVAVTAVEPGADGNALENVAVFLSTPIAGVDSEATVQSGGLIGGADIEQKASILSRLDSRLQSPPRGGSPGDWKAWALEVSSITRAFEFHKDPNAGFETIVILNDDAADLKPGATKQAQVTAYIEERAPTTIGGFRVLEPVSTNMALTLTDLVVDNASNRTKVEDAIKAYVLVATEPGLGLQQADVENAGQNAAGIATVSVSSPGPGLITPASPYGVFNSFTFTWVPASPP